MQLAVSMEPGASWQVLEMEGGIMMVVLATVGVAAVVVATMAAELEALVVALVTVALAAVTVGKVVMAAA